MKAKSWKKFVDKPAATESMPDLFPAKETGHFGHSDPLAEAVAQNDTLKQLLDQRAELEQKMAQLTGGNANALFEGSASKALGEIPSIAEKKKEVNAWVEKRGKSLQRLKKHQDAKNTAEATPSGLRDSEPASNLQPLSPQANVPALPLQNRFATSGKRGKKKDKWLDRKEKALNAFRETKKAAGKVKDSYDSLNSSLDRFASESEEFGGDSRMTEELAAVKDRFGTGSKLEKSLSKMDETFRRKEGGEKLMENWKKARTAATKIKDVKESYENRKKRLLSISTDTRKKLPDPDEKRKSLQEKRLEEKKAEKKEEERREQRREDRKRQKKERF